jgi:PadR family transcriptional regulator, regulatory protein PadR
MQKDFRTAWLLLLLKDGSGYGYELRRELAVQAIQLDPAVMYRSLRDMEGAGLISSHWMRSEAGPMRRVYDITDDGRHELVRIAATIRSARDAQSAFLTALERPSAGDGAGVP